MTARTTAERPPRRALAEWNTIKVAQSQALPEELLWKKDLQCGVLAQVAAGYLAMAQGRRNVRLLTIPDWS